MNYADYYAGNTQQPTSLLSASPEEALRRRLAQMQRPLSAAPTSPVASQATQNLGQRVAMPGPRPMTATAGVSAVRAGYNQPQTPMTPGVPWAAWQQQLPTLGSQPQVPMVAKTGTRPQPAGAGYQKYPGKPVNWRRKPTMIPLG
jgi:hypothetical protein